MADRLVWGPGFGPWEYDDEYTGHWGPDGVWYPYYPDELPMGGARFEGQAYVEGAPTHDWHIARRTDISGTPGTILKAGENGLPADSVITEDLVYIVVNGRIVQSGAFQMPTGAGDGKIIQSDADGNFSWQVAAGGVVDHGALDGLADDDHPQYLHLNKAAQAILQSFQTAGMTAGAGTGGIPIEGECVLIVENFTDEVDAWALDSSAIQISDDNVNQRFGLSGVVLHMGEGTIGSAYGLQTQINNAGGGTITYPIAIQVGPITQGAGHIDSSYGIYIAPNMKLGGTWLNHYGLYIDHQDVASEDNYDIYCSAADGKCYFGGSIAINSLNASQAVMTDANKNLVSADYLDQAVKIASSPTFAGITIADGGTIGQAAGPLLNFDDTNDYLEITGCKVGIGTVAPDQLVEIAQTETLTDNQTDGYAAALRLDPGYTAATAKTVTRHNYIDIQDVSNAGAGPSAVTDAAVLRFDANAGTHKALAAAANGASGFVKVNLNGTLGYIPIFSVAALPECLLAERVWFGA